MMKFLQSIINETPEEEVDAPAEKQKFIATVMKDGEEIEKKVKAFSIDDIKAYFGDDFVDAKPFEEESAEPADEPEVEEPAEEPAPAEDDVKESLLKGVHESVFKTDGAGGARLGSKVSFDSHEEWKLSLPSKARITTVGKVDRAQAIGKAFEGVAGEWDDDKGEGWIYSYYLDKKNLVEDEDLEEGAAYDRNVDALRVSAHNAAIEKVGRFGKNPNLIKRAPTGYVFDEAGKLVKKVKEGLSQLAEMAKRSKPDDFYAMAKKKYGADKVKSLKWSEVKAVADENDVLIPPYLRTQKVGRGLFNLVPPEHADSKPASKEEPKKAPSPDAIKASVARMVDGAIKDSVPKADAPKEYKYPQTDNMSYSDWSEFYGELKKRFGSFELERVPYGAQRQSRYGGQLGVKLLVDKKTDRVIGVWEVTGIDKVPGRGMVSYGRGTMAKEKQDPPKAAEKPVEKRAGGSASDDEMKTALLDVAAEMKSHKDGRGADWRMTPEKVGKRWEIDVRYWGHWEGDDGSGDYDFQELSSKSSKEIASILNQVEKRHKNVALSFQTSEKNWLSISAS